MSKWENVLIEQQGLNYLQNNGTREVACAGQPASYAEATTNYPTGKALGHCTMASGDYAVASDGAGGEKITMAQKTGIAVDASGTCDHVAIVDTVNSALLLVTTCTSQAVTSGNTMQINSYTLTIPTPT